jgi:O-antigen/teichoic acid export membrane protein
MLESEPAAPGEGWLRLLPARWRQQFAGRAALREVVTNAGWLVADKIVRLGIGVIVNVWVARYLGPADFGLFNYAQALVILFAALSTLGLPDIVVRDLVRMRDRHQVIIASAFVLRLAGAVVVLTLAVGTIVIARPHEPLSWLMVALVASAQLAQAMDVIDSQYQVASRVRVVVLIRNSSFVLFSALKVAAILLHLSVVVFAALLALELFFVAGIIYARAARDGLGFHIGDATLAEARRLLVEAAPLIVRLGAIAVYLRIDQVLVGRMLGDAAVGVYSAATRLTELWYFITTAVMTAVVPRLAQIHHLHNDLYEAQLVKVIRGLVWAAIGVAAMTTTLAPWIIHLLYGDRYAAAVPVLMIHAWAGVFGTMGQAVSAWFVNARLVRFGVYQAVLAAIANIALALVLIPRFGIAGGAYAAIAAQLIAGFVSNALFDQTRAIFWLQLRALVWR